MDNKEIKKLDLSISMEDVMTGVKQVVSIIKPQWNLSNVNFKVFTDGISNQLVGCFNENDPPGLLVRVYGVGTELFIDRQAEQRTMCLLSQAGQGPALLGTFDNGIVYEFVRGCVVTSENVAADSVWPLIATRLAAMHRLPLSSTPPKPRLWTTLSNFIQLIPSHIFTLEKYSSLKELFTSKEALEKEIDWLRKKLDGYESEKKVVFCHNDLLLANIVLNTRGDDVTFIDYEYAGDNYQAFDIANHFNEYAGVGESMEWGRIPDENYMRKWLSVYLRKYNGDSYSEDQSHQFCKEVQKFLAPSHLHWGLWAVVQSLHSQIQFDFVQYSCTKLKYYLHSKHY